jgi:hypothetical protein
MKFLEVQRPAPWVYIIMALAVGLGWWTFVQQILLGRPFGQNPAPDWGVWLLWAVLGLVVPLVMLRFRLEVSVDEREIVVRFAPVWTRRVARDEVESCEARSYRPIWDYGGWGIRYGGKIRGWAYTVRGSQGAFLILRDGKRLLIGSEDPRQLVRAIVG